MLENTFLEDWDEIGTKMAKKGHLLPQSGINSELVSIQRVKKLEFYGFEGISLHWLQDNCRQIASVLC